MKDPGGLRETIQDEAARLDRFYPRIGACRAVVELPKGAEASKLYQVRIDLAVPNGELLVKHTPRVNGAPSTVKTHQSRREAESVLPHKSPERLVREAFQKMRRRLQDYSRRQEGAVKSVQKMANGTVKEIFPGKGYGFLETTEGGAIYFNRASVLDDHFDRLRAGTRVSFAEEPGDKGPQASTVKVIRPRKQAPAAAAIAVMPRGRAAVAKR